MVYAQPNSWQCGPFALKHALLLYGHLAHEDELARLAGSTESLGTDERGLQHALAAFGGRLKVVRRHIRRRARQDLARWLARGVPVLLCVDQWDHWITAVADLGARVALFDSHYDNAVFRTEPWERLLDRVAYRRRRLGGLWTTALWDLHPVILPRPDEARRLAPRRLAALLATDNADEAVAEALLGRAGLRVRSAASAATRLRPAVPSVSAARPAGPRTAVAV